MQRVLQFLLCFFECRDFSSRRSVEFLACDARVDLFKSINFRTLSKKEKIEALTKLRVLSLELTIRNFKVFWVLSRLDLVDGTVILREEDLHLLFLSRCCLVGL